MKAPVTTIRLTVDEHRYAQALSLRVGGCKRRYVGSVAHGLKWCLRQNAKRERIPLDGIVYTSDKT